MALALTSLAGCSHAARRTNSVDRVTASSIPGVCQPAAKYVATMFRDADASRVLVHADPRVIPDGTVRNVGDLALRARRELRTFFGIPGPDVYEIFIAATTDEFDALNGTQTDWTKFDWIVGARLHDGTHLIRDPAGWSSRSKGFVNLGELIKHEMAHSFTFALNGKGKTLGCADQDSADTLGRWLWLEEGLASFAAGQHLTWRARAIFNFENYPHFNQIASYGNYTTAASAVEYLVTQFGKEQMLALIRRLPGNYTWAEHENEIIPAVVAEYAPTPLDQLERGWRKFALRTYGVH